MYNVTAYPENEIDYTYPSFAFPEKTISGEILNEMDRRQIPYSRRIKLGGAIYNYNTQEFEGERLVTVSGIDFKQEMEHLSNLIVSEGKIDPAVPDGALVWEELARDYHWKLHDEITVFLKDSENDAYPYTFVITGILGKKSGESLSSMRSKTVFPSILVSYSYLASKIDLDDKETLELAVWDNDLSHLKTVRQLAEQHHLELFFAEEAYSVSMGYMGLIRFVGTVLNIFILFMLVISSVNLNILNLFERQKEIATLVAIGADSKWITGLLAMEMFIFTLLAYAASMIVYLLTVSMLSGGVDLGSLNMMFGGSPFVLSVDLSSALFSFFFIAVIMQLSIAYPMYLASRLNPAEVFRESEI